MTSALPDKYDKCVYAQEIHLILKLLSIFAKSKNWNGWIVHISQNIFEIFPFDSNALIN